MSDSTNRSSHSKPKAKGLPAWLLSVIVLLLVGGVLLTIFAKPVFRKYKEAKASSLVEKANDRIDREEYVRAFEYASDAYNLAPLHPPVQRLMGELLMLTPTDKDRAIYFFEELRKEGVSTTDDGVNLAKCYFATGQPSKARELVRELTAADPEHSAVLSLQASIEGAGGNSAAQADLISRAVGKTEDPAEELRLVQSGLRVSDGDVRKRSRDRIIEIAEGDSITALGAVETMAGLRLTDSETETVIDRLTNHPEAKDRHRLMAVSLQIRRDPSTRSELIKESIKARLGKPIPDLVEFFQWLLRMGESRWVLDLLDSDTAQRHPETLGIYMTALSAEGKWKELDTFLRTEALPISEARLRLMRSQCLAELGGDKELVIQELTNAIKVAGNSKDYQSVADGLRFAERMRSESTIELGLKVLEGSPVWRERALEGVYRKAQRDGDAAGMEDAVKKILKYNPSNEKFGLISVYMNLLNGTDLEIAADLTKQFAEGAPDQAEGKLLTALAAFRNADYDLAVKIARQIEPSELPYGQRAVMAGLIELGGETRRAAKIVERIPHALLLESEKRFLNIAAGR